MRGKGILGLLGFLDARLLYKFLNRKKGCFPQGPWFCFLMFGATFDVKATFLKSKHSLLMFSPLLLLQSTRLAGKEVAGIN